MLRRTALLVPLLAGALLAGACSQAPAAESDGTARIGLGLPTSLDPAATGDAGSAAVIAQFFETLTTFDETLELRPALAESWRIEDGGRRVIFHIRPDLTFSDGSPLRAADVVRSWLRHHRPRRALAAGDPHARRRGSAGLRPRRRRCRRRRAAPPMRPRTTWSSISCGRRRSSSTVVASPTFGIVPPGVGSDPAALQAGDSFVVSGGYTPRRGDRGHDGPARQLGLLGGNAGDRGDHGRHRSRRRQRRRCLRGGRARLHRHLPVRCVMDRLRPGPRPAAPRGAVPLDRLLRVRYQPPAVRRCPHPASLRRSRGLAADRVPVGIRDRIGRDVDGPAGHPGAERSRRPAGPRPGVRPRAARRCGFPGRPGLPGGHPPDRRLAV